MRYIKQTISGKGYGNCFSACVASLLEIDIGVIPSLGEENTKCWLDIVNDKLRLHKHYVLPISISKESRIYIKGMVIIPVRSLNYEDQLHSVLWEDGVVVHDPTNCKKSYLGKRINPEKVDLLIPFFK